MVTWLKQNTAANIKMGPYVSTTDGFTVQSALTFASGVIMLSKNGATYVNASAGVSGAYDSLGFYTFNLGTGDINTLGALTVATNNTNAMPVWGNYMVVPGNVYDSLIGNAAYLNINAYQWASQSIPTPATSGYPDINTKYINSVATTSVTTINANQGTTQPLNFTGTAGAAFVKSDMQDILGTAVSSPATAGILDVNIKNMNNVAATSITTINANQGTTQPLNFTGTAGAALVKVDVTDIATAAVNTSVAQLGVNIVNISGVAVGPSVAGLGVNLINIAGSAVSTSTAQLGVNAVQIGAAVPGSATIGTVTNLTNLPATAATVANQTSLSGQIAALNNLSIDTVVASGNANGWNTVTAITSVNVSGFTPTALGQIVTSGHADGWANVTSTAGLALTTDVTSAQSNLSGQIAGLNNLSIATVIASGNSNNWNNVSPTIATIIASGNAAGWPNNTSGLALTTDVTGAQTQLSGQIASLNNLSISTVVASGNANSWNALTPTDLGNIVSSGNAASWNNIAPTIATIVASGNANNWNYSTNLPTIATIVSSGNANQWNATTTITNVNVSGFTPGALSQIVSSGHADGWANVTSTVGLALTTDVTSAQTSLSGQIANLNNLSIATVISSGNSAGWPNDNTGLATATNVINAQNTIIASGQANWVTAAGFATSTQATNIQNSVNSLPVISTIVASGNANNWQNNNTGLALTTDVTGIQTQLSGQIANLNNLSISTVISSGNSAGWNTVTPITSVQISGTIQTFDQMYDAIISGSGTTMKTALKEIHAYTSGNTVRDVITGSIMYEDDQNSGVFAFTPNISGRIRS